MRNRNILHLKRVYFVLLEVAIFCTYEDNLLHGILCRINVVTETIAQIVQKGNYQNNNNKKKYRQQESHEFYEFQRHLTFSLQAFHIYCLIFLELQEYGVVIIIL